MKKMDEMASPLAYNGSGPSLMLFYQYSGSKNLFLSSFTFKKPSLRTERSSSFGDHTADAYSFGLRLKWLREIISFLNGSARLLAGVSWSSHAFIDNYNYYSKFSQSETFGTAASGLDISFMTEFTVFHKGLLAMWFDFPILAFVIRPGYSGKVPLHNKINFIGDFKTFSTRFDFERPLGKRFNWKIGYHLFFYDYPHPRRIRCVTENYSAALIFKW